MTCIVGIVNKKEKRVVMGADSAGVGGYEITIRKDPKIFKVGDFVIGCTSSFRMIQLLRFSLKLPKVEKEIYEYMCTDFIDAVRKCLKEGGFMEKERDAEVIGTFLVAYKDRLFKIESDLQVGESVDGIMACGCGENYALGVLKYNQLLAGIELDTERIITNSLIIAEKLSAGVAKPFKILST